MVKEAVVTCIEAPGLDGIPTKYFIQFKSVRELYGKQVK